MQSTTITKQYIKVQSSAPSPASQGDIWYNSSTNVTYTYDGSSWNVLETDLTPIIDDNSITALEVIELQANTSVTPLDHDTSVSDTFSDADGYRNTVQTGTSTAVFSTNKYIRSNTAYLTDGHGKTLPSSGTHTLKFGFRIQATVSTSLVKITKGASCTATTAYIYDDANALIDSATFVGNDATFASPVSLTASSYYKIVVDSGGSNYTRIYLDSGISYPYAGTRMSYTAGGYYS